MVITAEFREALTCFLLYLSIGVHAECSQCIHCLIDVIAKYVTVVAPQDDVE
jgi:hypothetical protein